MTAPQHPVLVQLDRQRAELEQTIAARDAECGPLYAAHAKAWTAYEKAEGKPDDPETEEEAKLHRAAEVASQQLWGVQDAARSARSKLARLQDPANTDRLVAEYDRKAESRSNHPEGEGTVAKTTTPQEKREASPELVERIVNMIEGKGDYKGDPHGLTRVARILTDEKVPTLGKSTVWHPPVVRGIYLKASGKSGVKEVRTGKAALHKPALKDTPAAPAAKLDKPGKQTTEQVVAQEQAEHDAAEAAKKAEPQATPDPKPEGKGKGSRKPKETVAA